jgi:hypothetical protein
MSKYLPLWPDQASTMASQVDALYIYLLLVSGIMTALIFIAVAVLAIKYRRKPGREAHPIEGSTVLEIGWSVIPFFIMLTFFVWGAIIFFQERTPPADATEVYVVAKQWMWKIEHMEGQREINELHHDLAGRHSQLLYSRLPHQAGCLARPLHHALVQGHATRPLSPVLRRVLRNQSLGHGRRHRGHGAAGLCAMDDGRSGCSLAGDWPGIVRPTRMRYLPPL